MPLYALIASDTDFAVDVFVCRADAEAALRAALADEPGFADLLSIVEISDEPETSLPGGRP
jgi:hypothetical protein